MARKSKGKFTMKGYSPFKKEDETNLKGELACAGGSCEIT